MTILAANSIDARYLMCIEDCVSFILIESTGCYAIGVHRKSISGVGATKF